MKVILLKDVSKLGHKYDVKEVKSGYALNLLIPRGDAMPATPDALKRVSVEKAKIEGERKVQEELLAKNLQALEGVTVKLAGKVNDKGHLFAGLHREAISAELKKQAHLDIPPSFIELEHPIKEAGDHMIEVKVGGKSARFKLDISAS